MKNLLNQLNFWYADIDLRNIRQILFLISHTPSTAKVNNSSTVQKQQNLQICKKFQDPHPLSPFRVDVINIWSLKSTLSILKSAI